MFSTSHDVAELVTFYWHMLSKLDFRLGLGQTLIIQVTFVLFCFGAFCVVWTCMLIFDTLAGSMVTECDGRWRGERICLTVNHVAHNSNGKLSGLSRFWGEINQKCSSPTQKRVQSKTHQNQKTAKYQYQINNNNLSMWQQQSTPFN